MIKFDGHRNVEFSGPGEIRRIQDLLLKEHVRYCAEHSPYYRKLFREKGIDAGTVTLDRLAKLPLTEKNALSLFNDEFRAVPMSRIVDIVLSSGTTGKPTKVMYSEHDLQRLAYNEEISLQSCGLTQDDVVLLTCTLDRCFVAGFAYYSGIRALGAAAIRNGLNSVDSHLEIIQQLKPTVIVGVPTFLLKLGRFISGQGIDPRSLQVQKLVCIGEPIRDRHLAFLKIGESLEEIWGSRIYSTYASSETITSFCECTSQKGGHLHPDLAVVEIVNDQGEVLGPGETGEVVVTPLSIEGMPLLRFKTGDISFLVNEQCSCGRFSPRLGPILGRKLQMMKFRGTTLYPNSLYAVLDSFPGISEYYVTATSDFDLSDVIKVYVAVEDKACSAETIMDRLQAHLRVRPEVILASEESVRRQVSSGNSRKLIRFVDKRKKL
jgi:phenylacetate-CoA ligase